MAPLTGPPAPAQQAPAVPPAQMPQQFAGGPVTPPQQPPRASPGNLFSEPVLHVDRTFSGWDDGFSTTILDGSGRQLALANEQKPSAGKMAFNMLVVNTAPFEDHHVMVTAADGRPLFGCDRPTALSSRPCLVRDPGGAEIGRVTKGREKGRLMDLWAPAGYQGCVLQQPLATVFDAQGAEVAHMTEPPHRSMGFGEATQRYTVQFERPLQGIEGPLMITAILYMRA